MKVLERSLTGTASKEPQSYELAHREVARRAAESGMVLLKNDREVLPISTGTPVALYGAGAVFTIKGGTGSGDVNSRETVSIWRGLKNAGFKVTTEAWLRAYEREYLAARDAWKEEIWSRTRAYEDELGNLGTNFFDVYASNPFAIPCGEIPQAKLEGDDAKTAVFVVSRTAGEGSDRQNREGDYKLTKGETEFLYQVDALYENVVLVLNTGGLVELDFLDSERAGNVAAILYIHQPGMEAGNALANVLSGAVNPSAKLTDTWALHYGDYPNAKTFSHMNGNVLREEYAEGIFVGYRYFDTFMKRTRYGFGFGLSYTKFELAPKGIFACGLGTERAGLCVKVAVKNVGNFAGREVVQVYASCPQTELKKEFRRLVGFAKTRLLAPNETEELAVNFPLYALASFNESSATWLLEQGKCILMVGNSLENSEACGTLTAKEDLRFAKLENACAPKGDLAELEPGEETLEKIRARRQSLLDLCERKGMPDVALCAGDVVCEVPKYGDDESDIPQEVKEFVDALSVEQLIKLTTGDTKKGQGALDEAMVAGNSKEGESQIGSAGVAVPGSAAETSDCAAPQGLPSIVLADGPAGLRLNQTYRVLEGKPLPVPFIAALEGGFLAEGKLAAETRGEVRYQFCTAFPVGTALAQNFDAELLEEVGRAVAEELVEFGVTLWLAPGMNIHRNPLCGRNFEYYSEDPLVSGLCAAAITKGVQSVAGVGTTVKHFACNNQEDNRMHSDSVVSERALREVYLKGFELVVKLAQPLALMTSYNLVNGTHAANSYDLCTKLARREWHFGGVIMTDWTTTMQGSDCTASGCMRAGNDLVMPGAKSDHENLQAELAAGTLKIEDLKRSVARLVKVAWRSRFCERE